MSHELTIPNADKTLRTRVGSIISRILNPRERFRPSRPLGLTPQTSHPPFQYSDSARLVEGKTTLPRLKSSGALFR
eukprot:176230-Prorocentrum_minimum.AAC.2